MLQTANFLKNIDSLSNCIANSASEMLNEDELEAASLQSLFDKLYLLYEALPS